MRLEPCKVQGCDPESIMVQGCHAPYVVHGGMRNQKNVASALVADEISILTMNL
jgi:hypothetical protein